MMDMPADLPAPRLTSNAELVLSKRYYRKDAEGKATEDAAGLFWRVSSSIAEEEAKYEKSPWKPEALAREFYALLSQGIFLPNSPTLMNAGSALGQLSACFVLPVGDSIEEIFDAVKFAAMIHKSGGGHRLFLLPSASEGFARGHHGRRCVRPRLLPAHLQYRHGTNQTGGHKARCEHGYPAR